LISLYKDGALDEFRKVVETMPNGVIILDNEFMRGTDLKMPTEGTVMIYAVPGAMFKLSDVRQACGRSGRSFGQISGTYYTTSRVGGINSVEQVLQLRDE
jgi:hypothetical protein